MNKLLIAALASMTFSGVALAQQAVPRPAPVNPSPIVTTQWDPYGIVTTTPRTDENRGRPTLGRSGKGQGSDLGQ